MKSISVPMTLRQLSTMLWFVAASATAFGGTLVVPNAQATASGNVPISIGGNPSRIQEVVGGGQFASLTGPTPINALSVRAAPGSGPLNFTIPSIQVTLSTTQAFPNTNNGRTLPSATFSNNVGPDARMVYNGALSASSPGCQAPGPCPFDVVIQFTTPFTYDPNNGRLLIDLITSAPTGAFAGSLDGAGFADFTGSTVAVVIGDPAQPAGTLNPTGIVFGLQTGTSAQSPVGSYGILMNQWKDPNSNSLSALLGVLNFDGAGNISGSYTLVSKNPTATGSLTGTYSSNPDGSNTVNLTFDVGLTVTLALAVTDGGNGLQFLVTGGTLPKPGQVITGTGRIQSAPGTTPAGTYGYLLNQWPDANSPPAATVGVFSLDGAGNLTGTYTAIGNTGPLPSLSGMLTGTYATNPDGTGKVTIKLDIGITITQAIVVVDGGLGIQMLQTSTTGGGGAVVVSGTARTQ